MNTIPPELQAIHDQYTLWMIELKPDVLPDWMNVKGMVIRATDEPNARAQAASYARFTKSGHEQWWLSNEFSHCEPLKDHGSPGVLLANFT